MNNTVSTFFLVSWPLSILNARQTSVTNSKNPAISNTYDTGPIVNCKSINKFVIKIISDSKMPLKNKIYVNKKYNKSMNIFLYFNARNENKYLKITYKFPFAHRVRCRHQTDSFSGSCSHVIACGKKRM